MDCKDENIINLLLEPPKSKSELDAIKCLRKCEKQASAVLFRLHLKDKKERTSLFNLSLCEFIFKVRQGGFELRKNAKICSYVTEIAKRQHWNNGRDDEKYNNSKSINFEKTDIRTEGEKEMDEKVKKALNLLAEPDREILVAFYFYDQSLKDFAKQYNISHDATKQRLSRARKRFEEILKRLKNGKI